MNEKEVAELRRHYRADKTNINYVRGVFVNENREIISEFNQSLGMLSEEEGNAILSIIKKILSGSIGKNLIDIEKKAMLEYERTEKIKLVVLCKRVILRDGPFCCII